MVKLPGLRYRRDLAALTQQELADRAGVERAQISRFEHDGDARHATIRKLAEALDCLPADLIQPEN